MSTHLEGSTVVLDPGTGGNLITADGGQYLTVGPGHSLTIEQAQSYLNDALNAGVPLDWIANTFLPGNPEDYPRIKSGYFSDAGVHLNDQQTSPAPPPPNYPATPTTGPAIQVTDVHDFVHDIPPAAPPASPPTVDLSPPYTAGLPPNIETFTPDVQTLIRQLAASGITGPVTVPSSTGQPIVVTIPSTPVTAAAAPTPATGSLSLSTVALLVAGYFLVRSLTHGG